MADIKAYTRVKICGITQVVDALAAAEAGADAIGLVFYPDSPRYITPETAAELAEAVGPLVTTVGLFVNPDPTWVKAVLSLVKLHLLQFHGDETPDFCAQFAHPYLKAFRIKGQPLPEGLLTAYAGASGYLFDTWTADKYGGTGRVFDWGHLPDNSPRPVILAGGLTPDNVAQAVAATSPYGVDVSGGVEQAPGIKDRQLINRFIEAVRNRI